MPISEKDVSFEFDPFEMLGIDPPSDESQRQDALNEIADYIKTEVLRFVGDSESPVAGGVFKENLTPKYKTIKEKISGIARANLELYGDMLDSLNCTVTDQGLRLAVSSEQSPKAFAHNTGYK